MPCYIAIACKLYSVTAIRILFSSFDNKLVSRHFQIVHVFFAPFADLVYFLGCLLVYFAYNPLRSKSIIELFIIGVAIIVHYTDKKENKN